jgi:hypothetical protein
LKAKTDHPYPQQGVAAAGPVAVQMWQRVSPLEARNAAAKVFEPRRLDRGDLLRTFRGTSSGRLFVRPLSVASVVKARRMCQRRHDRIAAGSCARIDTLHPTADCARQRTADDMPQARVLPTAPPRTTKHALPGQCQSDLDADEQ